MHANILHLVNNCDAFPIELKAPALGNKIVVLDLDSTIATLVDFRRQPIKVSNTSDTIDPSVRAVFDRIGWSCGNKVAHFRPGLYNFLSYLEITSSIIFIVSKNNTEYVPHILKLLVQVFQFPIVKLVVVPLRWKKKFVDIFNPQAQCEPTQLCIIDDQPREWELPPPWQSCLVPCPTFKFNLETLAPSFTFRNGLPKDTATDLKECANKALKECANNSIGLPPVITSLVMSFAYSEQQPENAEACFCRRCQRVCRVVRNNVDALWYCYICGMPNAESESSPDDSPDDSPDE